MPEWGMEVEELLWMFGGLSGAIKLMEIASNEASLSLKEAEGLGI